MLATLLVTTAQKGNQVLSAKTMTGSLGLEHRNRIANCHRLTLKEEEDWKICASSSFI
jgi:hypothetical protein